MKLLLHVLFVIIPIFAFGQNKVTVSKSEFLIGEQTTIYYQINNFKSDAELAFNPWREVITCQQPGVNGKELEIISFRDTTIRENQSQWIGAYTITAWDTGVFIIPPHAALIDDEEFVFPSVKLYVMMPEMADGDEIVESELPFQDYKTEPFYYLQKYLPWTIGGLIVLAFIIWFLVKRNKAKKTVVSTSLPLLERTLAALVTLDSQNLLGQNKIKEHYIEASFILRNYLGEQFALNLLEKTSSQTRILLIAKGLPVDVIQEIQTLFNVFDSVKFAKFNPNLSESQQVLNQVKTCVLKINNWSQKDV